MSQKHSHIFAPTESKENSLVLSAVKTPKASKKLIWKFSKEKIELCEMYSKRVESGIDVGGVCVYEYEGKKALGDARRGFAKSKSRRGLPLASHGWMFGTLRGLILLSEKGNKKPIRGTLIFNFWDAENHSVNLKHLSFICNLLVLKSAIFLNISKEDLSCPVCPKI